MYHQILFFVLAFIAVAGAVQMARSRLITHAALFMAMTFTAVAAVFLLLGAEFLAAIQALIYTGAITTMVLFAIMLSELREVVRTTGERPKLNIRSGALMTTLVSLLFAGVVMAMYARSGFNAITEPVGPMPTAQVQLVGAQLFTHYMVPFEVASILLLVAMVGAIILTAQPKGGTGQ